MPSSRPKRRERTPAQQAAAAEARAQRLEDLHQTLADGVAAIRDGQAWADWLQVAGRFHGYSFNNQLLIAAQNPHATLVAGYQAWAAMGRQVRRGEKALYILAPVTRRGPRTDPDQASDVDELPETQRAADPGPDPATSPRAVVGFTAVAVFDVAQTDGDPLPTPPRPQLLEGQAPSGLWDALVATITARGYTVGRSPSADELGGANGVTDFGAGSVTVRGDVDDAQAVKTLAHEAGHVLLHHPRDRGQGPACRGLIEVEAESVAYLVAAHHGLPTDDYSFAYIATWAGRDNEAVAATARRVLDAARTLLEATDPPTGPDPAAAAALATAAHNGAHHAYTTAAAAAATHGRLAAALDTDGDRLRVVLADTQTWFQTQAAATPGYAAVVTARGYTVPEALGYGIGYGPASWTGLVDHLRSLGHPDADLIAAGVAATARGGRLIDRFRGRITFPIHDARGIVGFTARDTTGHPAARKYLNSPASRLFDKSRLLFGTQHLPTGSIDGQHTTRIVLTEGPWDALAVTHAGGGDTVGLAACGTAVTDHHLHLTLGPGRGRDLVLAPDTDTAGIAALGRTLTMLTQRGARHPHAVVNPSGKDLGELHASSGAAAVAAALTGARPAGIVYAQAVLAGQPIGHYPEARVAAARAAAAHTPGLTLGARADLGALLMAKTGIGPEAALGLVSPPAAGPRPVAAVVGAPAGPAPARPALRR
jgi:DNA primase catalytic core